MVPLEVFAARDPPAEREASGIDPGVGERPPRRLARVLLEVEVEARAGDGVEHARPQPQHAVVQLAGAPQRAEGDGPGPQRRQRADRDRRGVLQRVVAPERRKAQHLLGVDAQIGAGRIEIAVTEAIVDAVETGRPRVADPRHLHGRRLAGEEAQAVAGAVNGQVYQHVDPVGSHQLGRARVVEAPDVAKALARQLAVRLGREVGPLDGGVEEDLHRGRVVLPEQRHHELPDRMAAEVGRDVPHAQPPLGVAVVGVRPLVRAQRLGVKLRPGARLGVQPGGVPAGVGERHQDQVAVRVVIAGVELHGAPVGRDRAGAVPRFGEGVGQVVVGGGEVRRELHGAPRVGDRLGDPLQAQQPPGERHLEAGVVGAQRHRALQARERVSGRAGVHQRDAEVVVRLGEVRIGRQDALEHRRRELEPARLPVRLAQVGEVHRLARVRLHQALEQRARLLEAPRLEQQQAQHEQRLVVPRLLGQDLAVGRLGLLAAPRAVVGARAGQELTDGGR